MILCDVTGEMVSTEKHPDLKSHRILVVQPISAQGEKAGKSFLAIDMVDAGRGDRVLVNHEGHAPIDLLGLDEPPIRSLITCVVDAIEVGETTAYRKSGKP